MRICNSLETAMGGEEFKHEPTAMNSSYGIKLS